MKQIYRSPTKDGNESFKKGRPSNQWRPPLKGEIEYAISQTHSMTQAAEYLNVSYPTFRKWALYYDLWKPNYEHRGKKFHHPGQSGYARLTDIFAGKFPKYDLKKLLDRIIQSGLKPSECELCGYSSKNVITGRAPLGIYLKDNDPKNLSFDNISIRCYNCIYVTSDRKQINKYKTSHYFSESVKDDIKPTDTEISEIGISQTEIEQLQKEVLKNAR